ncbi:MAG: hypothetical protein RLZZ91_1988 [Bacteroidota bacterium]|jgi:hypothetical protein
MNKIFSLSAIAAVSLVVFSSCETEVDLTAPYASTTVVFGLLDPQADTQFVKITKTFLGDGNLNDYAMIRDSSEYKWEEFAALKIEEYATGNPNPIAIHNLQPITIYNKDVNGMFYGPEQTVYYFASPNGINPNAKYKLVADFVSRPDVFAWTNVIPSAEVFFQSPQTNLGLSFASTNTVTGAIDYRDNVSIRWTPIDNAEIYDLALRFYYTENLYSDNALTQLVSSTDKFIDWKIGTFNADDIDLNSGYYNLTFNAEPFFSFLGTNLETNTLIRREVGTYDGNKTRAFELRMGLANDELKTYINVNNPVTGIIQERPSYTNVVGGLGLFASRASAYVLNIPLESGNGTSNINALMNGIYTSDLNFCDPNPSNTEFTCN